MDNQIIEQAARTFLTFEWVNGASYSGRDTNFACSLTPIISGKIRDGHATFNGLGAHFLFVYTGSAIVRVSGKELDKHTRRRSETWYLPQGMYALLPGHCTVESVGMAVVMSRDGAYSDAPLMIGGPIEWRGRMRYIDGCTDSLLIPPAMMGDPCLNLLWFPPGIDQTLHTHPSARLGLVLSGRGKCRLPEGEVELTPGTLFGIKPDGVHAFSTPYGEEMRVLAFHPDSDFGPTHETHPMLNRTIIDGISAADDARAEYRTKLDETYDENARRRSQYGDDA